MKYPAAMEKFAEEQRTRDPKHKIQVLVSVNKRKKEYLYDAVAIVGIKHGSKVEDEHRSDCDLEIEVIGIGKGTNRQHLIYGLRSLLKRLKHRRIP